MPIPSFTFNIHARDLQFMALTIGPGLAVVGVLHLLPGIEDNAVKAGIALLLGPPAGIIMHRACVPHDHTPLAQEAKFEAWRVALAKDSASWRRVAMVATATLALALLL